MFSACLDQADLRQLPAGREDVSRYRDTQLSQVRNAKIGFVFQSFNLLARTPALENVEIPMVYGDGRVITNAALAALDRVGLARAPTLRHRALWRRAAARGDCPRSDQPSRSDPGRRAHGYLDLNVGATSCASCEI